MRNPLIYTANDELCGPRDLGHAIPCDTSVIPRVISCNPLDHNGTGMGVDACHPEAREPIIAPPAPLTRRNDVTVTRPTDGEGRITLFDHTGHLGPHAL